MDVFGTKPPCWRFIDQILELPKGLPFIGAINQLVSSHDAEVEWLTSGRKIPG